MLPDSGRGYLSKVFNDEWFAQYGFLPEQAESQSVGERSASKGEARCPRSSTPTRTRRWRRPSRSCVSTAVSQMPVVRAEPPVMAAEVAGSVIERDLLDAFFTGTAQLSDRVEDHMSPALPRVGAGEPASAAVAALEKADAVVVPRRRQADRGADETRPARLPGHLAMDAAGLLVGGLR